MNITLQIPDELIPCYEKFILKHYADIRYDETTGEQKLRPKFTVEEFIVFQIDALSDRIDDEFPPESSMEVVKQMEQLKQQRKLSTRARRVEKPADSPTEGTKK